MTRVVVSLFMMILSLTVSALPAWAQSTNAPPVLIETTTKLDPSTVPLTDDADKKGLTDYLANAAKQSGVSVLTSAANLAGVSWYFSSPSDPSDVADAARVALEMCEFYNTRPCMILSINGYDARDKDGFWPAQPEMLVKTPGSRVSTWTIPLNSQYNRGVGISLDTLANPSAIVISSGSGWSTGVGKTVLEVIDSAFAACAKADPVGTCVLYSVNGTVVMAR